MVHKIGKKIKFYCFTNSSNNVTHCYATSSVGKAFPYYKTLIPPVPSHYHINADES